MKTRISYLVSHPIQYFSPLFRALAIDDTIELTVYYCSNQNSNIRIDKGFGKVVTWDIPLLDGYASKFLHNLASDGSLDNKFWSLINLDIIRKLFYDKSEIVVIHGWSYFTNCLAIIISALLGKQVWLRGENPYNQEILKPAWLRTIKKLLLQFGLFKLAHRFLYIGSQNKNFYSYYGVPDQKLIYAPYCVDNDFFLAQSTFTEEKKQKVRTALGLPDDSIIIIFSGKYIAKKRPLDLLKAYARLKNENISLIMVGDGELRQEMENYSKENQLQRVILTGFINQSEIGNYYGIADIFVLPSGPGETWGLVVNEAMLFGLPIIVSDTVGSSIDLVKPGENGFIFREGDTEKLAEYLAIFINDKKFRLNAGSASRKIIERFSYSVMIENMKKHIKLKK